MIQCSLCNTLSRDTPQRSLDFPPRRRSRRWPRRRPRTWGRCRRRQRTSNRSPRRSTGSRHRTCRGSIWPGKKPIQIFLLNVVNRDVYWLNINLRCVSVPGNPWPVPTCTFPWRTCCRLHSAPGSSTTLRSRWRNPGSSRSGSQEWRSRASKLRDIKLFMHVNPNATWQSL